MGLLYLYRNFLEPSGPLQACNGTAFMRRYAMWSGAVTVPYSAVTVPYSAVTVPYSAVTASLYKPANPFLFSTVNNVLLFPVIQDMRVSFGSHR